MHTVQTIATYHGAFSHAINIDVDVLRLQVTMRDFLQMQVAQSVADLVEVQLCLLWNRGVVSRT